MASRNGTSADRAERQANLTAADRKRAAAISMRATGMGQVKRQIGGFNYTTIGDVDRFTGEKPTGRKPSGSVPAATLGVGKNSELTRTSVASPGKTAAQRKEGLVRGADAGARTVLPIDSAQAILSGKATAADWAIVAASVVPLPGKGAVRAIGKGAKAAVTPRTVAFASSKPLAAGAQLSVKEVEAAVRKRLTEIQSAVNNGAAVSAADRALLQKHGHWIKQEPKDIRATGVDENGKPFNRPMSDIMRPSNVGRVSVTEKMPERTSILQRDVPTRARTPQERSKNPTEKLEQRFADRVEKSRAEVTTTKKSPAADKTQKTGAYSEPKSRLPIESDTAQPPSKYSTGEPRPKDFGGILSKKYDAALSATGKAKTSRVKKQAAPTTEAKPLSPVERQRARDAQKLKDQGRFDAKAPSTAQGRGKNLLADDIEPPKAAAARKPAAKPKADKPAASSKKPKQPKASKNSGKVTASSAGKELVVRPKPGAVQTRPGSAVVKQSGGGEVVKGRVIKSQELDTRTHKITINRPNVAAKDPLAIGPGKAAKAPKDPKRLGPRGRAAIGIGAGVGLIALGQAQQKDKKKTADAAANAATMSRIKASDSRDYKRKLAADQRTKDGILDKFGRKISREEFNRRKAFREQYGLDKMTLAQRQAWRKANPKLAKAEEALREKYRQTEGKKRFGAAAIKKTRNIKKAPRVLDDRARKSLK